MDVCPWMSQAPSKTDLIKLGSALGRPPQAGWVRAVSPASLQKCGYPGRDELDRGVGADVSPEATSLLSGFHVTREEGGGQRFVAMTACDIGQRQLYLPVVRRPAPMGNVSHRLGRCSALKAIDSNLKAPFLLLFRFLGGAFGLLSVRLALLDAFRLEL